MLHKTLSPYREKTVVNSKNSLVSLSVPILIILNSVKPRVILTSSKCCKSDTKRINRERENEKNKAIFIKEINEQISYHRPFFNLRDTSVSQIKV